MKINDILELFNSALEDKINGHYISFTTLDRLKGPIKKCIVQINHYNKGEVTPIVEISNTENIASNLEEWFIKDTQKKALKQFFKEMYDTRIK